MAMMKLIRDKFLEAIPTTCPYCERLLDDCIDWEKVNEFLELIVQEVMSRDLVDWNTVKELQSEVSEL